MAEDVNEKCHKGLIVVKIIVLDKNDNEPKFQKPKYSVNVREDLPANKYLIKVCFFINFIRTETKVLFVAEYDD